MKRVRQASDQRYPDEPCIKGFTETRGRQSTGQQPGTKNAPCLVDKPRISRGSIVDFVPAIPDMLCMERVYRNKLALATKIARSPGDKQRANRMLYSPAVKISFFLFVLAKRRSEQLFSLRWRARGAVGFPCDRKVGTLFCHVERFVFDVLEVTRVLCVLGEPFCWHPALPDPVPPPCLPAALSTCCSAVRPEPIRPCYVRVSGSTGWTALMLPGKKQDFVVSELFFLYPKHPFGFVAA